MQGFELARNSLNEIVGLYKRVKTSEEKFNNSGDGSPTHKKKAVQYHPPKFPIA